MHQIGETIIHIYEGLSFIKDKIVMNNKEYFVVMRLNDPESEVSYIAVENADSVIRKLYNKKQADEFIQKIISLNPEFTSNTKQRRDGIKRKLYSGNMDDLAYLFKQFYLFVKQPEDNKIIRFGPVDLAMLKTAVKRICDELAIVYNINNSQIQDYIFDLIN